MQARSKAVSPLLPPCYGAAQVARGVDGCMKVVWMGGGCGKGVWKCMEWQEVKGLAAGCMGSVLCCEMCSILCGICMYL